MTEAPERIWAWPADATGQWPRQLTGGFSFAKPATKPCVEYVRADKVQALVEAAYRAGWDASGEGWNGEYPGNAHESDMWVSARAAALADFTDGGTQG